MKMEEIRKLNEEKMIAQRDKDDRKKRELDEKHRQEEEAKRLRD